MARYHMTRSEKEITDPAEMESILLKGRYITLALCRGNEPYVVCMNYGYDPDARALFFHSSLKGLKIDFLTANPSVAGTVVEDLGYVKGECEHRFRSAVIWGTLSSLDTLEEKKHGMHVLLSHLEDDPDSFKRRLLAEDGRYDKFAILKLPIDEITAKQSE